MSRGRLRPRHRRESTACSAWSSPVYGTRTLTKRHMVRNDYLPNIEVNPQTFAVTVDGVHATVTPPKTIALNQLYFFS